MSVESNPPASNLTPSHRYSEKSEEAAETEENWCDFIIDGMKQLESKARLYRTLSDELVCEL